MLLHLCSADGLWKVLLSTFQSPEVEAISGALLNIRWGWQLPSPCLGGGHTLENDPGWVQGFASSGAVGGDVTGNLI